MDSQDNSSNGRKPYDTRKNARLCFLSLHSESNIYFFYVK